MKIRAFVVTMVLACAVPAIVQGAAGKNATKAGTQVSVPAANNAFAIDLYGRLATGQGNLFFSPQSIHCALAMTYAGAKGETAVQMSKALHLFASSDVTHTGFAELVGKINASARGPNGLLFELYMANSLWGQDGHPFLPEFQKIARGRYDARMTTVDFVKEPEVARKQINGWVARQTRNKINDLLGPGVIGDMTRLILVNAIYFKGSWETTFKKEATRDEPFYVGGGKAAKAPMMHQRHAFAYADATDLQILELPYTAGKLSMFVLLPKQKNGLAALEKSLDAAKLAKWLSSVQSRDVQVALPRFKLTAQFSLAEQLKAMGMKDAFSDERADFSGIFSTSPLSISAVIHKAYADVNEEGTEAAAATGVAMPATSEMPSEPIVFNADHPFLFLIRHNETGAIMFMGRVMAP